MTQSIQICCTENANSWLRRRICEFLFTTAGVSVQFVSRFDNQSNKFRVYHGPNTQAFANKCCLSIPYKSFDSVRKNPLQLTYLDNIPVLYNEEVPQFLVREGVLGFDMVGITEALLTRREEYEDHRRDIWGCFAGYQSILHELDILKQPIIDRYIIWLRNWLAKSDCSAEPNHFQPLWPDGQEFAVALTHDVDFISYYSWRKGARQVAVGLRKGLIRLAGAGGQQIVGDVWWKLWRNKDPIRDMKAWTALEQKFGYRSTFFVVAQIGVIPHRYDPFYTLDDPVCWGDKAVPLWQALQWVGQAGWEIGLHGSYQSYLDRALLRREYEHLSNKVGQRVVGGRQHYLRFDAPKTWRIQNQIGFSFDSTLGYNDLAGFRAGTSFPFYPFDLNEQKQFDLLELPLTVMDSTLLSPIMQNLNVDSATALCLNLIDQSAETNGLIVLSWHTNTIDRIHWPGWFEVYERILSYLQTHKAWVAPAGEIAAWWQKRNASLSSAYLSE